MYIAIYLLNIFDLICTTYLVSKYGIEIELNPIGRFLYSYPQLLIYVKVLLVGFCLLILKRHNCKIIGYVLLTLFILLSIYHIIILLEVHKQENTDVSNSITVLQFAGITNGCNNDNERTFSQKPFLLGLIRKERFCLIFTPQNHISVNHFSK